MLCVAYLVNVSCSICYDRCFYCRSISSSCYSSSNSSSSLTNLLRHIRSHWPGMISGHSLNISSISGKTKKVSIYFYSSTAWRNMVLVHSTVCAEMFWTLTCIMTVSGDQALRYTLKHDFLCFHHLTVLAKHLKIRVLYSGTLPKFMKLANFCEFCHGIFTVTSIVNVVWPS